jgi:hypothetical protein
MSRSRRPCNKRTAATTPLRGPGRGCAPGSAPVAGGMRRPPTGGRGRAGQEKPPANHGAVPVARTAPT